MSPRLSSWKPSDPIQLLVFSDYKTGKTWGAYTFPRCVVFDFDKGAATGRNPEFIKQYGFRDHYYETFDEKKTVRGLVTQHNAFDESCRYFDEWMKASGTWKGDKVGRDQFDTFIIDSGTTLSQYAQNKAVMVLGGMKLSHSHEKGLVSGLIVPVIQDYGAERSLVEQFVDMVKDSGKNVVMICHEKKITEGEGPNEVITDIVPLLTGKSSQSVPLKFDEVYRLRVKPQGMATVRYLQTHADALVRVGSRYGIPDNTLWEYDAIKKNLDRIHAEQKALPPPQGA